VLSRNLRMPKKIAAETVRELEGEMPKVEAIQVLAFIVMLLVAGYAGVRVGIGSVWSLVRNIAINMCPIRAQRYSRIKLEALVEKRRRATAPMA